MSERTSNYDLMAEAARLEFLKWDQEQVISKLKVEHDDDFIYIPFFDQRHSISRSDGHVIRLSDGNPAGFNAVMSIYDALCYSKPGAMISGEWKTLRNLSPHSNFGASGKDMHRQKAEKYSGQVEQLKKACESLGGRPESKADVGYRLNVFPFLPMLFQFWEGDEEFSPKLSFLFDANTMDFIHFETAWYVADALLQLLDKKFD